MRLTSDDRQRSKASTRHWHAHTDTHGRMSGKRARGASRDWTEWNSADAVARQLSHPLTPELDLSLHRNTHTTPQRVTDNNYNSLQKNILIVTALLTRGKSQRCDITRILNMFLCRCMVFLCGDLAVFILPTNMGIIYILCLWPVQRTEDLT